MRFDRQDNIYDLPSAGRDESTGVPECLAEHVDVLIVGAGPAGMIVGAQLAQFPGLTTRIIDRRHSGVGISQADSVQARSMEILQAFGIAGPLVTDAFRVTEMTFWHTDRDDPGQLVRTARTPDDPLGLSDFGHHVINGNRIREELAALITRSQPAARVHHGYEFIGVRFEPEADHPVVATVIGTAGVAAGQVCTVRAKYLVGADGAHSRVREGIGCRVEADNSLHSWGVMDILAETDFPDIRTKCAISTPRGSILSIPRSGGHLFRMYVELGRFGPDALEQNSPPTLAEIVDRAQTILSPYRLDVREVLWHSRYDFGYRLAEHFDDGVSAGARASKRASDHGANRQPRVFIVGDACHTHSAQGGQGMNAAIQDGFNLGWKLGHVLLKLSPPSLLRTYSAERRAVAREVIRLDRDWATNLCGGADTAPDELHARTAEFRAGLLSHYEPSMVIGSDRHQDLAVGFSIGRRFRAGRVVRVADANPMDLAHHHRADGRWRIHVFAPWRTDDDGLLAGWARWLESGPDSPLTTFTPDGAHADSVFDVTVVYRQDHLHVDMAAVPTVFRPRSGPHLLTDREKVFAIDPGADIFADRGIDRRGVVVVVRPDQFVAAVLPIGARRPLADFFAGNMLAPDGTADTSVRATAAPMSVVEFER